MLEAEIYDCVDVSSVHEVIIKNVYVKVDEIPEYPSKSYETVELEYEGCRQSFDVTLDYAEAMPILPKPYVRGISWKVPIEQELVFPIQKGD